MGLCITGIDMPRPNYRAQIIALLKLHGPMTAADIADRLDMSTIKVGAVIASARFQHPGKLIRIVRYVPLTGKRLRDICVFAAKPGPDVQRKPYEGDKLAKRRAETKARYRDRNRAAINARSHVRKTARTGRPIATNPWLQLADPAVRATMARIPADSHRIITSQDLP